MDVLNGKIYPLIYLLKNQYSLFFFFFFFNFFFLFRSSTNPEIVVVETLYGTDSCSSKDNVPSNPFFDEKPEDGCSTECIVSVTQNVSDRRSSSFVIAEDLISGRKVRCEVYVDKIERIEIETTSRKMYHDDIEELKVLAFDSIGNLFSTLEGLEFQWSIIAMNQNTPISPLKFVPYAESNIEVSDVLLEMERKGKESYSVLVRGVESGKVHVSTHLVEQGYGSVDQSSVIISVLEPLELHPLQTVYITPGSIIQYELKTFKNEYSRTIPMPNAQYVWSTSNLTVASVDSKGTVYGQQIGSTDVTVQYEDMAENNAQGHVSVVRPARLSLKIIPLDDKTSHTSSNWYLVNGRSYLLTIEVYDSNNHRILTNQDLQFNVGLPIESFKILDRNINNAQHSILAIKEGLTEISASLDYLIDSKTRKRIDLPTPLIVRQEVVISSSVSIEPKQLRLPYDPNSRHLYPLSAFGGSHEYNWYSSNNTVATVDSRGRVTSVIRGNAQIMAADTRNPSNSDICDVSVLPVASVKLIPIQREALIGNDLLLAIAFYDENGKLFDNCTALSFQWTISDQNVFAPVSTNFNPDEAKYEYKQIIQKACTFRTVRALKEGSASISVKFGNLISEITIFSFPQVRVEPKSALVTLGSSYTYYVHDGPKPWYFEPGVYDAKMTPENPLSVRINTINDSNRGVSFEVTCLEHGDQTLTISVGNKPTQANLFPESSITSVSFSCQPPTSLFIHPLISRSTPILPGTLCSDSFTWELENLKDNSLSSFPSSFSLMNRQQVKFQATIFDVNGKIFDNYTSINIEWRSNNPLMAKYNSKYGIHSVLDIYDKTGSATVSGHVSGFDTSILTRLAIRSTQQRIPNLVNLKKEIEINMLSDVELNPYEQTLFLHSTNIGYVDVIGGSLNTGISSNDTSSITLKNNNRYQNRIDIIPRYQGIVKITVNDKCLHNSIPKSAIVKVSEIGKIDINVPSSIPVGTETELTLSVYDKDGNLFPESQYKFMEIKSHQDNHLIRIEPVEGSLSKYMIHGIAPGSTSISFHSFQNSGVISSDTKQIYVYPPFSLDISELILAPGISYQLQSNGGPPIGTKISYSSSSSSVATVNDEGIIKAISIGKTIVRGILESSLNTEKNNNNNNEIIKYGETEVHVTVRKLEDIVILNASNNILVGTEMNVIVFGSAGDTPFCYGTDPIYNWSSSNNDILDIVPRYYESGCTLEEEHMFSATIIAKNPGKSRISVSTELHGSGILQKKKELAASSLINVIEPLELLSPKKILLTPRTSHSIKTNLDHLSTLQYTVMSTDCSTTYNACEVSKHGLITTTLRTGNCFILIEEPDTAQSEILQIEVKPIDMIQIKPISSIEENRPVYLTIPLGSTVDYSIRYFDDLGREFNHVFGSEEFTVSSNTQEIISYRVNGSQQKISVNGLRPGSAIIRVSKDGLFDFIEVRVGNTILPSFSTVHIGSNIQFTRQYEKDNVKSISWESSNPSIISIDSKTGLANAKSSGTAIIKLYCDSHLTQTKITVSQIDQIIFSTDSIEKLTNYQRTEPYWIPITFFGNDKEITNFDSISYSCSVEPHYWASSISTIKNGKPGCLITLTNTNIHQYEEQLLPELLTIHVRIHDIKQSYSYESATIIPFYPEFILHDISSSGPLILNRNRVHSKLKVKHGLSDISAFSSNPNLISVRKVSTNLDSSIFEIQAIDLDNSLSEIITFMSSSTNQQKQIEVIYTNTRENIDTTWEYPVEPATTVPHSTTTTIVEKPQTQSSASQLIFISVISVVVLVIGYIYCTPTTSSSSPALKSPIKKQIKEPRKYADSFSPSSPMAGSMTPF